MLIESLYNIFLKVEGSDGQVVTFQCDKSTPIGVKAKSATFRPANGLEAELNLGGPRKADPVTVTKLYDATVDAWAHWLLTQAGRAKVVFTKQPIDENGHAFGKAKVLTGKLEDFIEPPTDSESEKPSLCSFLCILDTNVG
jgi:hypothetical protein